MKPHFNLLLLAIFSLLFTPQLQAQSTFSKVANVLQTNCSNQYCHGGGNQLDFTGDLQNLYNKLVNVNAVNEQAASKGLKLVNPGYPDNSFLFKKINNGLYHQALLDENEGGNMPPSGSLTEIEREIIREWIFYGASFEDEVDNEDLITEYYNNGGLARIEAPAAPAADEGVQIYFGTLWLAPGQEIEIHKKEVLGNESLVESPRIEIIMSDFSHHFAFYRYNSVEDAAEIPEGTRIVGGVLDAFDYFTKTEFIATSPLPYKDYALPENHAFKWDAETTFDINYHIKNYSTTQILPAEIYLNIYFQEEEAENEMRAVSFLYGDLNPFILEIEPTGEDVTFVEERYQTENPEVWNVWLMQAHTHQYGVGYNVYKRNEDGTKGELVYDGNYNEQYTYNQGFYDWAHPPVRIFDEELLQVDMSKGLIQEAIFNNPTDETIGFGLTTEDEMFATYLIYSIDETATSNTELSGVINNQVKLYPNPTEKQALLTYDLHETNNVSISFFDASGRLLKQMDLANQNKGNYQLNIGSDVIEASGVYFINLEIGQKVYRQKLIKM